jgi:hypothetical protein
MTINHSQSDLDNVLDSFQVEEVHDGNVLAYYVKTYPQFAIQLIDLSRLLATPEADNDEPLSSIEESRIDAAWIIHKAAGPESSEGGNPLDALVDDRSKALAEKLGVKRSVITCLRERKVRPSTVPRWIIRTMGETLDIPEAHVIAAMAQQPAFASGRSFKSEAKPGTSGQVSFEQVLIDAGISSTDRARLLAEGT